MSDAYIVNDCVIASMRAGAVPYGLIPGGALKIECGRIAWVGAASGLPREDAKLPTKNCGGRLVTPALLDCHTHLVFGGSRAQEFEMRLTGKSYQQIAQSGGGIVSTMRATREASEEALIAAALPRLDALIREGVAVVEVKSGYGLTIADELKMLRAARRLQDLREIKIVTSWLAAHALPPEYHARADDYIQEVAIEGLIEAHRQTLADAVDGFCESIAFTPAQIERVFQAARELGLPVKLHAEQLSHQGGAALAARYGALSVDHLEYINDDDVAAMVQAGSVAVLLPGAFYTLHETQLPPVQKLRDADVPIAVATDGNPGSSPLFSILLAMNMACTLFSLTPEEALTGVTRHAARALNLGETHGQIAPGMSADVAIWDVEHPAELAYHIGYNPLHRRIFGGTWQEDNR